MEKIHNLQRRGTIINVNRSAFMMPDNERASFLDSNANRVLIILSIIELQIAVYLGDQICQKNICKKHRKCIYVANYFFLSEFFSLEIELVPEVGLTMGLFSDDDWMWASGYVFLQDGKSVTFRFNSYTLLLTNGIFQLKVRND